MRNDNTRNNINKTSKQTSKTSKTTKPIKNVGELKTAGSSDNLVAYHALMVDTRNLLQDKLTEKVGAASALELLREFEVQLTRYLLKKTARDKVPGGVGSYKQSKALEIRCNWLKWVQAQNIAC